MGVLRGMPRNVSTDSYGVFTLADTNTDIDIDNDKMGSQPICICVGVGVGQCKQFCVL